ncbi:MAG TPA: oligosaccharide flippase family protein [Steroidobacteraceae bacterium]|nr:oligosaccharide flippase family protein [Steroidobacteraceae bacterium]
MEAIVASRERTLRARLGHLWRSPALWSAVSFAVGGVGFAAGNLLLARVLPEDEYGRVALFLALVQIGIVTGPLGMETVVNRHRLSAHASLLGRVSLTSACVGAVLALVAWRFYGLGATLAGVLALTVIVAAVNRVGGAFFQSRSRFGFSLFLILIHNWIVLVAVPVVLFADRLTALPVALTVAAGYIAMATLGWFKGFVARVATGGAEPHAAARTLWYEGLAAVGLQLAVGALFQLDRLLIPRALSIRDLAVYSVVSSIAASPFRMLQTGLGFALLPRLRACESRTAILRLVRHEVAVVTVLSVLAAVAVLVLTPWLLGAVLDTRYSFSMTLLYALVLVGFVRVWSGVSGAVVSALGSAQQLARLNLYGWLALIIAAAGAFAARGFGLPGVVYGMGAGWLALAVAGTLIGWRALAAREPSGAPRRSMK